MQREAIVPVDMAQSVVGPGMEVFSRYAKVVEADGTEMRVREAIGLVNEVLQEVLSSEDAELDADTRWALTWYEQHGHDAAPYGNAETLATAKNTSVAGVERAGIIENTGGKVRLLTGDELEPEWDPVTDPRRTDWKLTQYLIAYLAESEVKAGNLLRAVGIGMGDRARRLAWLLHQIAERREHSSEAVAYNGLIKAWHDLTRHAASAPTLSDQTQLGI
jgi:putative DNA methylase